MQAWLGAEGRRFANTCIWSWQGWAAAWASEKTLRPWTRANVLPAAAALALPLGVAGGAVILALGLLLLAAEMMTTAVETVVNHLSPEPHPLAGKAKDCASAAVALTALAGGLAWLVVLWGLWSG